MTLEELVTDVHNQMVALMARAKEHGESVSLLRQDLLDLCYQIIRLTDLDENGQYRELDKDRSGLHAVSMPDELAAIAVTTVSQPVQPGPGRKCPHLTVNAFGICTVCKACTHSAQIQAGVCSTCGEAVPTTD
jgi:hypothetical protein